jgi:phosphoenolpyruvate carboxykinase (GTP)
MHQYEIIPTDWKKLEALDNPKVMDVVQKAIELFKPKQVLIFTDDPKEISELRHHTINLVHEEVPLKIKGHTIHYDGFHDQARDKGHTAVLLPEGQTLSRGLNVVEREKGLKEILGFMDGAMENKIMVVRFFCLGPVKSKFSIPALQITDSFYVAHSEDILYRPGYNEFMNLKNKDEFFYFYHSAGKVDARNCTINIDKRRIYIDPLEFRVFSVNNQYAGNSLACKKLALRLGIWKSNRIPDGKIPEFLTEHMFISAFSPIGHDENRKTYFAGAYPSACGKTSTAMIPGTSIVGDDIAYLRKGENGELRAVNIEQGLFGIIKDVNPYDDPEIYKALTSPKEMIFSNVLTTQEGVPYWLSMGKNTDYPEAGYNHSGYWYDGKKDGDGNDLKICHPNARYTLRIEELENLDENLHKPNGVQVDGILYGGRDSDTTIPVAESLNWNHGVFIGATIESETTSATLGKAGVRKSSPMANMDFIIVPLAKYFKNHLIFGNDLSNCPKVFSTNYFLKGENGDYLNTKLDKKVWILWAEGRIHNEFEGIPTPIGILPKYEDLKVLFNLVFVGREYTKPEYEEQFSLHINRYLEKFDRMESLFKEEEDMPSEIYEELTRIRTGLKEMQEKFGKALISPFSLY